MSLRELIYDILHVNKPKPSKLADWIETADMTFQDNTWFLRDLEEQGKHSHFPENRKDYVLDANDNDGDGTIFRVGIEIMEELCRGKTVLTAFKAYDLPQRRNSPFRREAFPSDTISFCNRRIQLYPLMRKASRNCPFFPKDLIMMRIPLARKCAGRVRGCLKA